MDIPDVLIRLYEQAMEITSQFKDGRCDSGILRSGIERLPEFLDLEQTLLPIGLGEQHDSVLTLRGGKSVPPYWSIHIKLSEFLWQLGIFSDFMEKRKVAEIWDRIYRALTQKPIARFVWLELEGCRFPDGFEITLPSNRVVTSYSNVEHSFLSRQEREDRELVEFRALLGDTNSRRWGLLSCYKVPQTIGEHYSYELKSEQEPPSREAIIDEYWSDLLSLALCDSGFLNVSAVSEGNGCLEASTTTLHHYESANSPFHYSTSPQFVISAESRDQFVTFLERISRAINENLDSADGSIEASRLFLRARLYEHPELDRPEYSDECDDIFLRYFICLEKLVRVPSEHNAPSRDMTGDPFKPRVARLVGRTQKERKAIMDILDDAANHRNSLVHARKIPRLEGSLVWKPLSLLCEIARRALATTYLLLYEEKLERSELMQSLFARKDVATARAREVAFATRALNLATIKH